MAIPFSATHEVTLWDADGQGRRVIPVQLVSGVAYAPGKGGRLSDTGWRFREGVGWSFPGASSTTSVRQLRRGPMPRAGSPSRPFTIRASDRERQRWVESARRDGQRLSTWVRAALDRASDVSESRRARRRSLLR